jgi:hypothetical protein
MARGDTQALAYTIDTLISPCIMYTRAYHSDVYTYFVSIVCLYLVACRRPLLANIRDCRQLTRLHVNRNSLHNTYKVCALVQLIAL